MFPVFDVSDWERLNAEPMGTKPKFWCLDATGAEFLFKESRPHSGEHWSEKIAEQIAVALGLPHAEIELATRGGRQGTISRKFLPKEGNATLAHGNELLFEHDPMYPKNAANFRLAQHTLDRIFDALQKEQVQLPADFRGPPAIQTASDVFVGYLLLDALIVNTDRHHANWAVVVFPKEYGSREVTLAPTFDHASSLGRELSDTKRQQKLNAQKNRHREDQTIAGYLTSDKGRSRIYFREHDEKPMHPMQIFQQTAVRFAPAADAWIEELSKLTTAQLEQFVKQIPPEQMSPPARDFSLCLLNLNRDALLNRTFSYA